MTHQRRSGGKGSAIVTFQDWTKVTAKKDAFLANRKNKKRFIAMLQRHLSKSGCRTFASWGWCRCSYRQNSDRLCRDASHSARRRWYRSVSATLLSHESRRQRLVLSARGKGQINFAVRPNQINFAVRLGDGKLMFFSFFYFFFLVFFLVTRNEENIMLSCPQSIRRSKMN